MSDIVTLEVEGHVAVITLNRPEARNAVNGDLARGLEAAIDRLEDDPDLWVGSWPPTPPDRSGRCSAPEPTSKRSAPATRRPWSPDAVASPASPTASDASR